MFIPKKGNTTYDKKHKSHENWVIDTPEVKPNKKGRYITKYNVDKFFIEYLSKKVIF